MAGDVLALEWVQAGRLDIESQTTNLGVVSSNLSGRTST